MGMHKKRVLFICIHNSARSQMAEGWLRHIASERFEVESAGLEPGTLNPFVVQAMRGVGVDISHHTPKSVLEIATSGRHFDYVIAVCDKEAAERCPIFPGEYVRLHWNFPDPSKAQGEDDDTIAFAASVRDMIRTKLTEWLDTI